MPLTVAIVGSGPSGFYTADALLRASEDCEIDIIERLPCPFGLIRYGVAPDHQTTKNVARNFTKVMSRDRVRYFGNVEIGRDISLENLRSIYDAVVLATGAPLDRPLGIPGDDKRGVIGAAALVGWYNGHPDFRELDPPLDHPGAVVIGNGNVAVDIARILSKTRDELASGDIVDHALDDLARSSVTDVYLIGRRGPLEAKFTNVELRELGELKHAVALVDVEQLPDNVPGDPSDRDVRLREKNLATLREFAANRPAPGKRRLHVQFYAAPIEILGEERVSGIRLERTRVEPDGRARGTGEFFDIECGLVLPAIGYRSQPIPGTTFDERKGYMASDEGRVAPGLYVVGWLKRGPTGVISTNRPDGKEAARHILAEIAPANRPGREALVERLEKAGVRWIGFDEWLKIDAAEIAAATDSAPRRKFATIEDMLAVLG